MIKNDWMTFDMINKNSYYSLDLSHNLIQVNHNFAILNYLIPHII